MLTNRFSAAVIAALLLLACTPSSDPGEPLGEGSTPPSPMAPGPSDDVATEPVPAADACEQPCRRRPRRVGTFARAQAPEASGLAASRRNPGLLYVLDDGPGTTSVLVLRADDARILGRLAVNGLDGTDTESLAVGRCRRGGPWCLYIGDIGDNLRQRASISVTRVREPALRAAWRGGGVDGSTVALRYPARRHDAEALLVGNDGTLAIVTKAPGRRGAGAARLFTAPRFRSQTLQASGRVALPAPRAPLASLVLGTVVTGGDSVAGRVVLRTYDALYEFTAPSAGEPLDGFARWPVQQLPAPDEPQGEAVTYAADGCSLFTVSEDSGRLTSLRCP